MAHLACHMDIVIITFAADIEPIDMQDFFKYIKELVMGNFRAGVDIHHPFDLRVDNVIEVQGTGDDLNHLKNIGIVKIKQDPFRRCSSGYGRHRCFGRRTGAQHLCRRIQPVFRLPHHLLDPGSLIFPVLLLFSFEHPCSLLLPDNGGALLFHVNGGQIKPATIGGAAAAEKHEQK